MARRVGALLVCVCVLAASGCAAHFNDPLQDRSDLPIMGAYPLHLLSGRVKAVEEYREVLADDVAWARRWPEKTAPTVDFSREMVLAAAFATSPDDAGVGVFAIEERDDEVRVQVRTLPMYEPDAALGYYQHYHFVRVPRVAKPVRFVDVAVAWSKEGRLDSVVEERAYAPIAPPR